MQIPRILVIAACALACSCCFAATPANSSQAAKALNAQAKKSLGVSVRSLAFLFDTDPGTVLAMNSVSLQSSWHFLEDLEGAGLVKLHKFGGTGADYLSIELTPKGQVVAHELSGP